MREFTFKHTLTRDVAYASLPRAGSAACLHRRVAEWIQEVAPDRGLEMAELAAQHYGRGARLRRGREAVRERAAEVFLTAGEGALQRDARLGGTAPRTRARARRITAPPRSNADQPLAKLVFLSGGVVSTNLGQAEQRLESALAVIPADAAERSDALAWGSRVHWLKVDGESAAEAAHGAVEQLRGLPESPQLARALARRSQLAMLRDNPDAESLSREALTVATRVGDRFALTTHAINVMSVGALHGDGAEHSGGARPDRLGP